MQGYLDHPFCQDVFEVYEEFYPISGYSPPWIGYFAQQDGEVVGVGGFKGAPVANTVEIAYGVIPEKEGKGIATQICSALLRLAIHEDLNLEIIAHTLCEENASTRILGKHGFEFQGVVNDPDDGDVWKWKLPNSLKPYYYLP